MVQTDGNKGGTTLPYSLEAEQSVLGAILIDKEAIVKVADLLDAEDFYDQRHQRIYEAVLNLYAKNSPIDILTLAEQIKGNGFYDMVGGPMYLTNLTNFVPTAAHVEQYAALVSEKSMRRKLVQDTAARVYGVKLP